MEITLKEIDEEKEKIEQMVLGNKKIILYGMGMMGKFGYEFLANKVDDIICVDGNAKLWGGRNPNILSPDVLADYKDYIVVITPVLEFYREIQNKVNEYGMKSVSLFNYIYYIMNEKYKEVYDLFEDEYSKKLYLNLLYGKMKGDSQFIYDYFERNIYFALPQFNCLDRDFVFVDCGAFVGDTIEQYITNHLGFFKKIYAFEPGKSQFECLKRRTERVSYEWGLNDNKIVLENMAIGDKAQQVKCENATNNFHSGDRFIDGTDGTGNIKMTSLDEYFLGLDDRISMIKADIEGNELAMLKGAHEIIKRDHPLMAISLYHRMEDLFIIPLYIRDKFPEYKLSLRQHLPQFLDTVLYCY